ncbi:hypothetical protein BpHYR1_017300 [Brachionus plicatilis]|uniref:Uncharacterized protein n=1 Tax=Brachionus plicatilis TaxID=10195 RepID=A0A3M7R5I3_BRAPC|nr:hypothetical protein BpHYR1_017300 [Brachionus plicatilis]
MIKKTASTFQDPYNYRPITVRFFLKLKYDTPSKILHHEALNKLKVIIVSNRLFQLNEKYVAGRLRHSVPLTVKLVDEYEAGY